MWVFQGRLTSISPTSGSVAGGTSITITGTGFTGATGVTIGGVAANFNFVSATSITATTPAGSVGTASVLVTTSGGTNAANALFTYTAAPSPPPPPPPTRFKPNAAVIPFRSPNMDGSMVLKDSSTGEIVMDSFKPFGHFPGGVQAQRGDFAGKGSQSIVMAAGEGGGPHVIIMNPTTMQAEQSFFAYSPVFRGGLFICVGDVNGDGVDDLVTGPNRGGGPHVKVFDGKTMNVISEFMAYDPGFTGGVSLALADVNGDGRLDIVTGAGVGGGPLVRVFDPLNLQNLPSGEAIPFKQFFAFDPGFLGGIFVAAGDINGNGTAEIVVGMGAGNLPLVRIFNSQTQSLVHQFFAYAEVFRGGVRVGLTDYNGDGGLDILTGAGPGGGPHVKVISGANFSEIFSYYSGVPGDPYGTYVNSGLTNNPLKPTFMSSQVGNAQVKVAWKGGTPDGSPVLNYEVSVSLDGRNFNKVATTTDQSIVINSLPNRTAVAVKIRAVSTSGKSADSVPLFVYPVATVSPFTPGSVAKAFDQLTAEAAGNAALTWLKLAMINPGLSVQLYGAPMTGDLYLREGDRITELYDTLASAPLPVSTEDRRALDNQLLDRLLVVTGEVSVNSLFGLPQQLSAMTNRSSEQSGLSYNASGDSQRNPDKGIIKEGLKKAVEIAQKVDDAVENPVAKAIIGAGIVVGGTIAAVAAAGAAVGAGVPLAAAAGVGLLAGGAFAVEAAAEAAAVVAAEKLALLAATMLQDTVASMADDGHPTSTDFKNTADVAVNAIKSVALDKIGEGFAKNLVPGDLAQQTVKIGVDALLDAASKVAGVDYNSIVRTPPGGGGGTQQSLWAGARQFVEEQGFIGSGRFVTWSVWINEDGTGSISASGAYSGSAILRPFSPSYVTNTFYQARIIGTFTYNGKGQPNSSHTNRDGTSSFTFDPSHPTNNPVSVVG